MIVSFALVAAGAELWIFGARTPVLTFLTGLLVLPATLRIDEARRKDS